MAECHARQHDIAHIAAAAPEEARILEPGHALADREFTHLASSEISKGSQLIAKPWYPGYPPRAQATARTPARFDFSRHLDGTGSPSLPERGAAVQVTPRDGPCRPDLALDPLHHGIEELHLLLPQIAQHVFGDGRKSFADQDVKAERRQRSAVEGFGARRLLLQCFLRRVLPGDDTEAGALERGPRRLRRKQKADALVARPRRRVVRLACGTGRDVL